MLIIQLLSAFPLSILPPNYTNFYLNLIPVIFYLWFVSFFWSIIIVLNLGEKIFPSDSEILAGPVLPLTSSKTQASI